MPQEEIAAKVTEVGETTKQFWLSSPAGSASPPADELRGFLPRVFGEAEQALWGHS